MPSADPGVPEVRPADVERWLADLALAPIERVDREGITSWDLVLDGRRRFDLRVTLILDPSFALLVWAPFAPPINDMFRKSYRKLLRWNDAFPFAKFGLTEDERPLLMSELPIETVDAGALGQSLARTIGIADRLFEETVPWLWIGRRKPDQSKRTTRNARLLAEYAEVIADLEAVPLGPPGPTDDDEVSDDAVPATKAAT
jgi:hypothetical protein